MKRILLLIFTLTFVFSFSNAKNISAGETKNILIFPLDERPINTRTLKEAADIMGYKLIFPNEIYYEADNSKRFQELSKWVDNQTNVDALIVSLDGLFYGGLMNSREIGHNKTQEDKYINLLYRLKKQHPGLKILGYKTIPRITPNVNSKEDLLTYQHYQKWNKFYDSFQLKNKLFETEPSNKELTFPMDEYISTRSKHLNISKKLLTIETSDIFDALVFSQDDTSSYGLQHYEQSVLKKISTENKLKNVRFVSGTDEIDFFLLSKFSMNKRLSIFVYYLNENNTHWIPPFEQKPIKELVDEKVDFLLMKQVKEIKDASFVLVVNNMKEETDNKPTLKKFLHFYNETSKKNIPISIADYSYSKDDSFFKFISNNHLWKKDLVYAKWNTTSNTLGLSLSQSSLLEYSEFLYKERENNELFHYRLIKDHYYKKVYMPNLSLRLKELEYDKYNDSRIHEFENELQNQLNSQLTSFITHSKNNTQGNYRIKNVTFPYSRLFEIDLELFSEQSSPD